MHLKSSFALSCAVVVLAGCASRASSVAPVAISASDYQSLSCEDAKSKLELAREQKNVLTRKQNNAATADAASVFLVLLPLGSVFGSDVSGELAQAKGEVLALERAVPQQCAVKAAAVAPAAPIPAPIPVSTPAAPISPTPAVLQTPVIQAEAAPPAAAPTTVAIQSAAAPPPAALASVPSTSDTPAQ